VLQLDRDLGRDNAPRGTGYDVTLASTACQAWNERFPIRDRDRVSIRV